MSSAEPAVTFRAIGPEDSVEDLFDLDDLAFHTTTRPGRRAHLAAMIDGRETYCAYDGGRLVGSSLAWAQRLSVPGGELPCGAVSWVSVAPTHRRRGLLRTMMEHQLRRLAETGTPLAVLWASEATIYGRFGFGPATGGHSYEIRLRERDSGTVGPAHGAPVTLEDPAAVRDVLADIYRRVASQRAGVLSRDERWWTHGVLARAEDDAGDCHLRVAIAGSPPDGYVLYRVTHDEEAPNGARGVIEVQELTAVSSQATRALWSYLLSIDLVGRINAHVRPVDDPLGLLLTNPRTAKRTEYEALWLRILDLPRALTSRDWSGSLELVLEVEDDVLSTNAGRWRLTSAEGHTECVRTSQPADLALTVAQLATVYLGGGSMVRALDAGLIDERTPGAAARLDRAARTVRAPWNISVF